MHLTCKAQQKVFSDSLSKIWHYADTMGIIPSFNNFKYSEIKTGYLVQPLAGLQTLRVVLLAAEVFNLVSAFNWGFLSI